MWFQKLPHLNIVHIPFQCHFFNCRVCVYKCYVPILFNELNLATTHSIYFYRFTTEIQIIFFFLLFSKIDPLKDVIVNRLHLIWFYYWRDLLNHKFVSFIYVSVSVYACNLLWLNFHYFKSLQFVGFFLFAFTFHSRHRTSLYVYLFWYTKKCSFFWFTHTRPFIKCFIKFCSN